MEATETFRPVTPGHERADLDESPSPPASDTSENVGVSRRHLGPYELLHPLGSGGMAEVWAAVRRGGFGFHQFFAIKMIRSDFAKSDAFRRMFLSEARLASKVRHTNVVQVLDLGEDLDTVYQAMPLVDGDSLSVLIKCLKASGRRLPISAALRIVVDAARGLHAAHEATDASNSPLSIVHLDVSPQNILVGVDGVAKVSDFGIARALGEAGGRSDVRELRGKLCYLAPEQLEGAPVDRRADVFSLGVVLYELLLGARLFGNDLSPRKALPPLPADVPPELARIARKALATKSEERTPTTELLADEIEAVAHQLDMVVSAREVGRLVHEVLGAAVLDERRQNLLREVDATLVRTGFGAETDPSIPVPIHISVRPAEPRSRLSRSRRRWALSTLAIVVVLGTAFSAVSESGTRTGPDGAPPVTPAQAPPAPAVIPREPDDLAAPGAPTSDVSPSPTRPAAKATKGRPAAPSKPPHVQPKFSRNPYAD